MLADALFHTEAPLVVVRQDENRFKDHVSQYGKYSLQH